MDNKREYGIFRKDPIYANFMKRLGSFFIDILILFTLLTATVNIAGKYFNIDVEEMKEKIELNEKGDFISLAKVLDQDVSRKINILAMFYVVVYYVSFWSSKKQATIGNMFFNIMVVHVKKGKLNILNAFIRLIASIINIKIFFLGCLIYFFKNRTDGAQLQDLLSDTRVINLQK